MNIAEILVIGMPILGITIDNVEDTIDDDDPNKISEWVLKKNFSISSFSFLFVGIIINHK